MTPAWTVRAWPPVLWQAESPSPLQLSHVGTRVLDPDDGHGTSVGQTIWASSSVDGEAGVAWDWVHMQPGIVALADPMSLVTNLCLLGPCGERLTPLQTARRLNEIVHSLPWQHEVQRALGRH